ncbi:DNA primase [environmental Halophage eHP-31]|nr:DNA primase [environmental Halophage eHP-31]
MSDPRPKQLIEFLDLLTEHAPAGYEPWLFRVEAGTKAPDRSYGSWKDDNARLSKAEAVHWMEDGGNVGIAGRPDDPLINVDIDDEDKTTADDLKETLTARSRSRTGSHAWYFEAENAEIPNIPTDDAGEVRANWQYVVAPGSYVETDPEEVPADERDDAGYYTIENAVPVTSLRYEELPGVFQQADQPDTGDVELADDTTAGPVGDVTVDEPSNGRDSESALFEITARDVAQKEGGRTDTSDRWAAIFHDSETGKNMSLSNKGLLHCWRHEVALNGLQALCVLSEYRGDCADVGTPHQHSGAGQSCLKADEGEHIWFAWKYAKQNGYIPSDDPVPYSALKYLCRTRDLCAVTELPSGEDGSIPAYAYDAALSSIENADGLDPGRVKTDEIDSASGPAATADGGAVTTDDTGANTPEPGRSFEQRVHDAIAEFNEDVIQAKTARHYIAQAFVDKYHFVYPEDEVRGWRPTLYVYDKDEGVYEPRGEYFVEKRLERIAGDFTTNTVKSEIIGKIKRMSIERDNDEFRRDPERLVVGNGILDLHTGTLDNYTPHEYHRTKIDIDWQPDAGEPGAIDEFFHDIVDDSDVDTLYRLIAHTIYKEYIGEKAAILIGSGENGKSVFLDFVEQFLGQYNVTHRELQDFSDDPYAINNLEGKLANLATEIGEQELADTTAFKKATGRDVIDARVKYEGPVTFENFATLMFATNNMPVFGQDNHAIWRRWLYLEFPYEFSDDDDTKDPVPRRQLMRRLTQERQFEALLVRCQQEIQRWYEGDELFADAMDAEEVRSRMKKAAEPVYAFATDCLKNPNDDDVYEQKSIVRAAYQAFADAEELPRIADNEFGNRLLSLRDYSFEGGRKRVDGSRVTVYKRCQLSTRGRQVLGLDEPSDDDDQETVDGDFEQAKPRVLDRLAEMVDQNDGEPVSREALAWSVPDLGKSHTEQCIDGLLQAGRIIEVSGGLMPN